MGQTAKGLKTGLTIVRLLSLPRSMPQTPPYMLSLLPGKFVGDLLLLVWDLPMVMCALF